MQEHLSGMLHRISGLLRTRVIMSSFGMYLAYKQPASAQAICVLVGLALGVSAIDAIKGNNNTVIQNIKKVENNDDAP